ncbi:MAG: hypothetical protein RLZ22_220 [Verrucomicrobiota bacterium]
MIAVPQEKAPARAYNTEPGNQSEQLKFTASSNRLQQAKVIDLAALEAESPQDYFHAPTETFLVRNDAGRWQPFKLVSYRRILTARGLTSKIGKGEDLSEIDLEILRVQMENDVSRYGPLCGKNSGFYESDGCRHLVTEDMVLIEAQPGSFPTISAVINGLFRNSESEDVGSAQIATFLGWLKSSVEALRAGRQQQQQALAICGVRDCGKSFVQHHIVTPCLAGRAADAERYFLRGNDFNADLFAAEHLVLDDCRASTSIKDRLAFAAKLKQHTVGSTVASLHGKGKDAITVRPWWRISITCNDDPESLLVLPPLNEDFADKLILLRASRFDFPEPITTAAEKGRFEAKLRSEIPAFLDFLLNRYSLPEKYVDPRRYNVATYHHPVIKECLESLSPEAELLELIDLIVFDGFHDGPVWISASDLENKILASSHHRRAERIFTFNGACARYLARLSKKSPSRVMQARTAAERGWRLSPKNDAYDA